MADIQKGLDYTLEPGVLKKVHWAISNYYKYASKAKEIISDDEYESYPMPHYGTDPVAYTSTPSRKTESLAMDIIERKAEIKDAKDIVEGIDKGIFRAAMTINNTKLVKGMYDDLKLHIIDGVPNRPYILHIAPNSGKTRRVERRPDTLRTYKRRAFYFIAVELHLIEASEDILRAERRGERSMRRG